MFVLLRSYINSLPYDFPAELAAFTAAKEAHRYTVNVPAPTSYDLVEAVYHDVDGYQIEEDEPIIDEEVIQPVVISKRQFYLQLLAIGMVTQAEVLAVMRSNTLPAAIQAILAQLDEDNQFNVEMFLIGAIEFERNHYVVDMFASMLDWTSEQVDDFFNIAQTR